MGRACSTNGGEEERIWVIVGKPEEKRPLGRPRRRWMDNIRFHEMLGNYRVASQVVLSSIEFVS
jgi:hypothetical protein